MHPVLKAFPPVLLCGLALACGKGGGGGGSAPTTTGSGQGITLDLALLTNITSNIVLPSYQALLAGTTALDTAAKALQTAPTAANLTAAQAAWRTSRIAWEQAEGMSFGPQRISLAEQAMDTFPIETAAIQSLVGGTARIVGSSLPSGSSGFHAAELYLFGTDGKQTADKLTARSLTFLTAVTGELVSQAAALQSDWQTGFANANGQPFTQVFLSAGSSSNLEYPSLNTAAADVVAGLGVIANELQVTQMQKPFTDPSANPPESVYSGNTLRDFTANVQGMQNIYLGAASGATSTPGDSFSARVQAVQMETDTQIQADLTAALAAIAAIPEPYSTAVTTPADAPLISTAMTAVGALTADFGTLQSLVGAK